MADFVPKPDSDLRQFAGKLVAAVVAAPAVYASTAVEATAMEALQTAYVDALAASDNAQNAARAAVAAKEKAKEDLVASVRKLNNKVQNLDGVTDEQLRAAGLPVRDMVRSNNAPVTPSGLVVTPDASGTNSLVWNGGANTSGIKYVIQSRKGATGDFNMVDVVTATKYDHKGCTPGESLTYRVLARRGDVLSDPSNTATAYA